MNIQFPPRLNLAQTPTPLTPLDRLSEAMKGPRIWVKRDDMTGGVVSGNKIRKLEFCLARALEEGCDTIITAGGVQSNHCRATAILCAQLGLRCHLVLRGDDSDIADGNLMLDKLVGATISFYRPAEFVQRSQAIFDDLSSSYEQQGHKVMVVPIGASDGTGLWGYIAACEELRHDFQQHAIHPGHIISATGSGGTQGGLTVGNQLFGLNATVWGVNVCDDADYFINKVGEDIRQWYALYQDIIDPALDLDQLRANVIEGYVGPGYAKATAEIFDTIKLVAQTEGLVLDPVYTGKGFHGMLDQLQQGRFDDSSDIVFIHTGGVFGLYPYREQL